MAFSINSSSLSSLKKNETIADKVKAAKAALASNQLTKKEDEFKWIPAKEATDRISIIFDTSSSMNTLTADGKSTLIKDAVEGTIEFMRYCAVNSTAISIFRMHGDTIEYTTNLPELSLAVKEFKANGDDTPLYETCDLAFSCTIQPTRLIIFSDGYPNRYSYGAKEELINKALEKKIPIDSCFFGKKLDYNNQPSAGYELLKEISDRTGGICLCFDSNKVDFKKAFKYLTPGRRLMLTQGNNKEKLEEGKLV